jgi:hypothetical protein
MDLHLHFQKGIIRGEGADGLDSFAIEGVYDVKKKEAAGRKFIRLALPSTIRATAMARVSGGGGCCPATGVDFISGLFRKEDRLICGNWRRKTAWRKRHRWRRR